MGDLIEQKKIISAEQTEQVIIKALVDCMIKHKGLHETSDAVLDALHNIPAADAVPVVHGKWKMVGADKRGRGGIFVCSACDKCSAFTCDYCPNCGAKMDEEGDAE